MKVAIIGAGISGLACAHEFKRLGVIPTQAVSLPIKMNTHVEINYIINDFDYIIVATGSDFKPNEYNLFTPTFDSIAKIALVTGDFKTESVELWWNIQYCNNGLALPI